MSVDVQEQNASGWMFHALPDRRAHPVVTVPRRFRNDPLDPACVATKVCDEGVFFVLVWQRRCATQVQVLPVDMDAFEIALLIWMALKQARGFCRIKMILAWGRSLKPARGTSRVRRRGSCPRAPVVRKKRFENPSRRCRDRIFFGALPGAMRLST